MIQAFVFNMLAGRRERVTVVAGRPQDQGLIRYARGHITILNHQGFEATVCECY